MQLKIDKITESGAILIALSPMLKIITASLVAKLGLNFPVLCDTGNKVAQKYGLSYTLADAVQPIYKDFGIDLTETNGDNSHQLPIPATYIIDNNGEIRFFFADVDHTTRLDPELMLKELVKL